METEIQGIVGGVLVARRGNPGVSSRQRKRPGGKKRGTEVPAATNKTLAVERDKKTKITRDVPLQDAL